MRASGREAFEFSDLGLGVLAWALRYMIFGLWFETGHKLFRVHGLRTQEAFWVSVLSGLDFQSSFLRRDVETESLSHNLTQAAQGGCSSVVFVLLSLGLMDMRGCDFENLSRSFAACSNATFVSIRQQ